MYNIPPHIIEEIKEQMRRPEGTFTFNFTSEDLFNPEVPGGIIFEITSDAHIFRLERDNELNISFYHSSPGTGTRISTINLTEITPCPTVFIAFTWTTKNIQLYVVPRIEGGKLISSEGILSPKQLVVDKDGAILEIGNDGVEVMDLTIYKNGQMILQPTALEAWKSTVKAVEILHSGSSDEGHIFDVIVTNLTIVTLVTGFETYCKRRFIELEKEGITPDTESLVERLNYKIDNYSVILSKAQAETKTVLQYLSENVINFQSYEECKRAYNKAYGLKFGNIGVSPDNLDRLQRFIRYRHGIIHVDTLRAMLNQRNVPPEEPEFSTKELGEEVIDSFKNFINKLHESTLYLKRSE
jgi:hypothetical protein